MTDSDQMMDVLDARVKRRGERRDFFKAALGAAAFGAGATALAGRASAQTLTDADILNFALNLEYLEAQFYSYAATGQGLPTDMLVGAGGSPGAVTGGRKANLQDRAVQQYAREIAQDEIAHVRFLRTALGSAAVAAPAIDVGIDPNGAFSSAARAAGLVGAGEAFNPYADDNSFLLGAYIFEDVGVTAYKGAAPLLTNNAYVDASAGILAAEAFHAGIIRTALYARGVEAPTMAISDARDSLDGDSDLDQGVAAATVSDARVSNIAPTDANGITFSLTASQVLHIVYLSASAGSAGGFFPRGLNGTIKTSVAN